MNFPVHVWNTEVWSDNFFQKTSYEYSWSVLKKHARTADKVDYFTWYPNLGWKHPSILGVFVISKGQLNNIGSRKHTDAITLIWLESACKAKYCSHLSCSQQNHDNLLLHDEKNVSGVKSFLLLIIYAKEDEYQVKLVKFMFCKKATKNDEIFTVDLTLTKQGQIDGEDFVNFRGLLRKTWTLES